MTHEHLSDEQLSTHLDGEATDETPPNASSVTVADDIAACDVCRRRLTALAEVRRLVGRAVDPVAPSMRASAVEAALAEGLGSDIPAGSRTPTVVPLDRRGRRWPRGQVAAVAAVALLVVVGVSVGLSHRSSNSPSAASTAVHAPAATPARTTPDDADLGRSGLVALGSFGSPSTLGARLGPAVGSGQAAMNAPTASSPGGFQTSGSPQSASATSAQAAGVPSADASCVSAAAKDAPGPLSTQELVATLTYKGTPALVVVFASSGASSGSTSRGSSVPTTAAASSLLAVVVARSGCRVLTRFTF